MRAMKVYLLWHCYPEEEHDDNTKLLGVYSSKGLAERKITEKYATLPGFDRGEGEFIIDAMVVDEDQWSDGFFRAGVDDA